MTQLRIVIGMNEEMDRLGKFFSLLLTVDKRINPMRYEVFMKKSTRPEVKLLNLCIGFLKQEFESPVSEVRAKKLLSLLDQWLCETLDENEEE